MSVRPIVFAGGPTLRETSRRVRDLDGDTQELIGDMIETMRAANGIGLAAVQVGELERIIVVEVPEELDDEEMEEMEEPPPTELYVIVNPELVRTSREMEEGIEGCLSIPGWVGEVERHQAVVVEGMTREGDDVRIEAEGLLARVLQHEIDHCHGVLYIDRIDDPEKIWSVEEGEEEAPSETAVEATV